MQEFIMLWFSGVILLCFIIYLNYHGHSANSKTDAERQHGSHHFLYLVLVLVSNVNSEEPLLTLLMVWVSSGNKVSAVGPCVRPLIILEGDVKDYLKLGRKVKIPSARFQSRFCETQMNRKWRRKETWIGAPREGKASVPGWAQQWAA